MDRNPIRSSIILLVSTNLLVLSSLEFVVEVVVDVVGVTLAGRRFIPVVPIDGGATPPPPPPPSEDDDA